LDAGIILNVREHTQRLLIEKDAITVVLADPESLPKPVHLEPRTIAVGNGVVRQFRAESRDEYDEVMSIGRCRHGEPHQVSSDRGFQATNGSCPPFAARVPEIAAAP